MMIHIEQDGKPLDKKCPIDIFGHCPNKFGPHPPLSQTVPLGTYGPYLPFPEVKQILFERKQVFLRAKAGLGLQLFVVKWRYAGELPKS